MKRLVLTLGTAALPALLAVAAPALSLRPYHPPPVDFELAPAAGNAAGAASASARGIVSPVLRTPRRFNLVGFRWRGSAEPAIAIRTRLGDGRWSAWKPVGAHAEHRPDEGTGERAAKGSSDPVWAGEADQVQYRLSQPLRGLRLHFVNTLGTATASDRAANAVRRFANAGLVTIAGISGARAQGGPPALVTREEWGAASCTPRRAPNYGEVKAALVHHTVSTNDYTREQAPAAVLAICRYHRNSNGWDDIGYNFLVDRYGALYEGRAGGIDRAVIGAQAQGFNSETTGIANLGTHTSVPQTEEALNAMARLIGWKLPLHGAPTQGVVTLTSAGGNASRYPAGHQADFERISGHRDTGKTACPGEALYGQLPSLRSRVGGSAPTTSRTRIDARFSPRMVVFPGPVLVTGRLRLLKGDSVPGAAVAVEQLERAGWRRLAGATTRSDGSFDAEVRPAFGGMLRVSYAGGESLRPSSSRRSSLRVRPRLSATRSISRAKVGQTPQIEGTIDPARSRVLITIQRREGRRNLRVARYSVRARGGRFRKGHRIRKPGLYRYYAAFKGDSLNSRATSTPFYIRVVPADGGAAAGR